MSHRSNEGLFKGESAYDRGQLLNYNYCQSVTNKQPVIKCVVYAIKRVDYVAQEDSTII